MLLTCPFLQTLQKQLNMSTMSIKHTQRPGPGNYHGVYFHKSARKFCSIISGKPETWVGSFNDEESAALAYDKRMRELERAGPFNFPEQPSTSKKEPTAVDTVDANKVNDALCISQASKDQNSTCKKDLLPVTPQSNNREMTVPDIDAPSRPVRTIDTTLVSSSEANKSECLVQSKHGDGVSNFMNIDIPDETQCLQTDTVTRGAVGETDEVLTPRVQGVPESAKHSILFPTVEARVHFKEIIRGAFERGFGVDMTLRGVAQELEIRGYALPPTNLGEEGEDSALLTAISEEVLQVWLAKQADRSSTDSPLDYCHSSKFAKLDRSVSKVAPPVSAPPKRKASPYMLFCNAKRKNLPASLTFPEKSRLLGEMWRDLDEKTKDKYKAKAKPIQGSDDADHPISSNEEDEVTHNNIEQNGIIQDIQEVDKAHGKEASSEDGKKKMDSVGNTKEKVEEKGAKENKKVALSNDPMEQEKSESDDIENKDNEEYCGYGHGKHDGIEEEESSKVGKKRGRPPKKTTDKSAEASKILKGPTPEAKPAFDEDDDEDDEDLPPEWHALPREIKAKEMEVVWARYHSKHAAWPALVYNPSGVAEPLRSRALNCCTKKYLIYFYGSNEWSFISFKLVKPFGNPTTDAEMAATAAQLKALGARKKEMYEKGVRLAKKEAKLKDKWQRAEWLCS